VALTDDQVHGVNANGAVAVPRKLRRSEVLSVGSVPAGLIIAVTESARH
jgi:hypothetical protein